jgi:hypothetical protein
MPRPQMLPPRLTPQKIRLHRLTERKRRGGFQAEHDEVCEIADGGRGGRGGGGEGEFAEEAAGGEDGGDGCEDEVSGGQVQVAGVVLCGGRGVR